MLQIAEGTTVEFLDDSDLPGLGLGDLMTDSTAGTVFGGVNASRPALAVTFEEIATGGEFTAVINHFKSKSGVGTGADADQLDGQGAWQQQREFAAEALTKWLGTDPTKSGDSDVLVLGDLNAYFQEDAIDILKAAGYTNLQEVLSNPYSFTFDGQIGSLDYVLSNKGMSSQITGVTEWHINSDEADALDYNLDFGRDPNIFDPDVPVRVSDHDPLLVGIDLAEEPAPENFVLQLLHLSDGEAGLLAGETAPIMGALIDKFDDQYANTLVLSGGDNFIPGPFLNAGTDPSLNALLGATAPGRPDIAMLNAMGVEVSAIGNHEWDLGSQIYADAIKASGAWTGANFALVSANLDFTNDAAMKGIADNSFGGSAGDLAGDEASTIKGKVAPWVTVTEGGEKIGILGATTQILERISSPTGTEVNGFPKNGAPGDGTSEVDDMTLLAAQLQPIIDQMIASGINKIVLQSHLQDIENEKLLATKLEGVDIILSAGSNTRLGDADDKAAEFPGHSADFEDTYPLVTKGLDGKSTLIVNTDSEYTYLGRLVVEFDENGDIVTDKLDDYQPINGAYASTQENLEAAYGKDIDLAFAKGSIGDKVQDITKAVDAIIAEKDGNVFGFTDVYLEGERNFVRSQETNFGNLSADANSFAAKEALGGRHIRGLAQERRRHPGPDRRHRPRYRRQDPADRQSGRRQAGRRRLAARHRERAALQQQADDVRHHGGRAAGPAQSRRGGRHRPRPLPADRRRQFLLGSGLPGRLARAGHRPDRRAGQRDRPGGRQRCRAAGRAGPHQHRDLELHRQWRRRLPGEGGGRELPLSAR